MTDSENAGLLTGSDIWHFGCKKKDAVARFRSGRSWRKIRI